MQTYLSYGDGESAVKISFQNERILHLFESTKVKNQTNSQKNIRDLVDTCMYLQEENDLKLRSITDDYKNELNTYSIKRQIIMHLKILEFSLLLKLWYYHEPNGSRRCISILWNG